MNALSTHHRPLRRSSGKSSHHSRDNALYSRFRPLVAEALEDRCLLTLGIPEVGQVANEVGQVANLPNDAITPAAAQAVELFNVSPALFVENLGQWSDPAVRYAFQGSGANVLHTQTGPVIQLFQPDPAQAPDDVGPALPAGTAGPTTASVDGALRRSRTPRPATMACRQSGTSVARAGSMLEVSTCALCVGSAQ